LLYRRGFATFDLSPGQTASTSTIVDEFIRAAEFLSKFGRRKSMIRKHSSYGLKHDAEREPGDYVANGMLIAAALALGFSAERTHAGSPNAYFNISSRQGA